jgi:hypothetical protein
MDQLRKAWGWLQRQHFWVLSVIALLVALGVWWTGGAALSTETKANRGVIDSGFSSAGTVRSKPFHANERVQSAQSEQITEQQKLVSELWKELYGRQTASVLKWPGNLSEEFREHISRLTFGEEIARNLRAHYNNYIRDHFPELPKIVGALEEPDTGDAGGGMSMGGGMGGGMNVQSMLENMRSRAESRMVPGEGGQLPAFEEPEFLVIWADQQQIRSELAPRSTPSSKRIWKTQEDLWVYEALLHIIAKTNKEAGADRFSNAPIRVIESLEVGRTAAQASRGKGRIDMVQAAPAGGMGEGEMGMEGAGGPGSEMAGMMSGGPGGGMEGGYGMGREGGYGMGGEGGADSAAADMELFNNRYVSADGTPIPDPNDGTMTAFGTEFKRLPVRMRLWMDQRYLPQLIAECANAPLQVEVQEVRINPAADGMGGGGGMGGDRGGYGGGGGYGGAMGASGGVEMVPEQDPNMKTVVLQGTVYIFNPPVEASAPLADAGALPE